jgi:pimeloyl-[acyl-carrier protein] synthase
MTIMDTMTLPRQFDMSATNIDSRDPYGLVTTEIFSDPHSLYHMLRYSEPVHWSSILNAWILTRYDDVMAAFKDPRLSNAMRRAVGTAQLSPELRKKMAPIDRFLLLWVLNLDDPEHHKLRVLLSKAFTPAAMEAMRSSIVATANELLDRVQNDREIDFVAQYAHPLPVRVIGDMFGMPEDSRDDLNRWSKHISTFFEIGPARVEALENMTKAVGEMTDHLRGIINDNRNKPQNNILGRLIQAKDEGRMLSEDQLLATCIMLLFAGHDSTVNLLGSGMYSLLTNRGQLELLRANPELIRTAVDEFLRYESPVMRHDRVAREDITLHGKVIRAGQRVILGLGAANRDPAKFANPDVLDITRKGNRHTTFGNGPHACLGASLACTQVEIAINLALERFPNIRLAPQPARWREHFNFRGLRSLPVLL